MSALTDNKRHRKSAATNRRFVMRYTLLFGGIMSLLGIAGEYSRYFGWHLGFDSHFALRAIGVAMFWLVLSYLTAL